MADIIDRANDLVQKNIDAMLEARGKPHDISSECIECSDAISEARQKATNGTDLCVDCAGIEEAKARLYR